LEIIVTRSILRKCRMSILRRLSRIEGVAPSIPNVPVLKHQRKEVRLDGRHPEQLLEIVLGVAEW
jgi:hypothetical protein